MPPPSTHFAAESLCRPGSRVRSGGRDVVFQQPPTDVMLNRMRTPADSCSVTSAADNHPRPTAALALHCRSCSSPLVQASGWTKRDDAHWTVRLWCPECWHDQMVVLDQAQASYLSLAVEEGFALVLEALEGLDAILTIEPRRGQGRIPD